MKEYDIIRPVASLAVQGGGKNDMGVYKREGRGWEVAVNLGDRYDNGRIKYYRELVKTKKEALEREKELIKEYKKETQQMIQEEIKKLQNKDLPDSINFKEAAEEWLNTKKLEVRLSTFEGYKVIVEKHLIPYFETRDVANIDESGVRSYLVEKSKILSGTTLRHHYSTLNMILKFKSNYCMAGIKRPRASNFVANPIRNKKELEKLIGGLKGTVAYLPARIAAVTGMRHSEVAGLQWRDISFTDNIIRVRRTLHWAKNENGERFYYIEAPKTKRSRRSIIAGEKVIEELKTIKEARGDKDTDYVCRDTRGRPIFKDNTFDSFRKRVSKIGYPNLRFHDLRHSHATILINEENVDAQTVQLRLGHSDISTTLAIYTAESREKDKEVAEKFNF